MKKIAMIATDVALTGEKGLGRMHYLAELLGGHGYEVELITSRFQHWLKRFRTEDEMDRIRAGSRCAVTFLDEMGYSKNVQLQRIFSRRGLTRRIVDHLRANRYDLIYCQIPDNHLAAACAACAQKKGIPFVVDIEDLWPEAMRMVLDVPVVSDVLFSGFARDAEKAYRLASAAVGSSDTYRDAPRKYRVDIPRAITVYVGNDLAAFDVGAAEHLDDVDKPEGEFWVTYAGTLGTSYDIPTLIRAADILEKRGAKGLRIMLLGDGPKRSEFEALAKSLRGQVRFVGYVNHGLMAAYLKNSDVTVNSLVSKASQSIVSKIGDYLAAGCPMINTGLDPEFREKTEEDGFGVNVPPEDPKALADAIEALMRSPEIRAWMGGNARRVGERQFDRARSYRRILRLLDDLLGRSGGTAPREEP